MPTHDDAGSRDSLSRTNLNRQRKPGDARKIAMKAAFFTDAESVRESGFVTAINFGARPLRH
jgi:hypothetical protein